MHWQDACKLSDSKKAVRWTLMGRCFIRQEDGSVVANTLDNPQKFDPVDSSKADGYSDWEVF